MEKHKVYQVDLNCLDEKFCVEEFSGRKKVVVREKLEERLRGSEVFMRGVGGKREQKIVDNAKVLFTPPHNGNNI